MADETTHRAEVKDTGRAAEENSCWVREGNIQSQDRFNNWRLGATVTPGPAEHSKQTEAHQSRERDGPSSPLFSLKMYLRRGSSASSSSSSSSDSLSPPQNNNVGVDCAGIVLNCLFCRFYDLILMLPDSCERVVTNCCPNYKQVEEATLSTSSEDDSCMDMDCGLIDCCQDGGDCLELAMEVSEICYH